MTRLLVDKVRRWSCVAFLLAVSACSSGTTLEQMRDQSPTRGFEAWKATRAVLGDIAVDIESGREFRADRYSRAVCYFERVTGLSAHDDGTDSGRMPTGHLRDDLVQWDR